MTDAADIPRTVAAAFHVATTGRPGPVLIDLPKDVSQSTMDWYWPEPEDLDLPGYHPTRPLDAAAMDRAATLLATATRPVLYVGGGVLNAGASPLLRALAERTGAPVVTTLMARGAFPDSHPQHLGMPGMHGTYAAVTAIQGSDLLVALGSRFDDRVTGSVDGFAPHAKVIHVDIDPAEHAKVRTADVSIVADCAEAIRALLTALESRETADLDAWWRQLHDWQARYPLVYDDPSADGPLRPQLVVEALRDHSPDDTIVASGVGQHQMWASQYWRFEEPRSWINSGGLGTMGFAVPASIGAKVGRPDRTVWAIDGDGCFQMTAQELVTATVEQIPVKMAILNNSYLGMVRQWQEMFYDERYSEVFLSQRPAELRAVGRGDGLRGPSRRLHRRRGARDREGKLDRRPARGHRLPDRRRREGVPDGRPPAWGTTTIVVHPSQGTARR